VARQVRQPDAMVAVRPTVTMRDIAQRAGVTPMTVSRALSRPEKVSAATRRRIEAVIDELGFIPNQVAGSLSSTRSRIVTAVVATLTDSLVVEIVQGLSDELTANGYQLLIAPSRYQPAVEEQLVRASLGWRPAGVVLTGFTHTRGTRRLLSAAGMPVVEINEVRARPIDMAVGLSNFDGGYAMTRFLVQRGYRRIGFVHLPTRHNERMRLRRDGFFAALRDHGLPATPDLAMGVPLAVGAGRAGLVALLERHPDLDAVFFASEPQAIGAVQECHRRGIAVPGRLAVATWGDSEVAAELEPPLTALRSPRYAIGKTAAACILRRLDGSFTGAKVLDLGFEIVPRKSA
jgi:LacI family transcriptional regulator, gluconate utilization system Gnt-I transcriptional repressor